MEEVEVILFIFNSNMKKRFTSIFYLLLIFFLVDWGIDVFLRQGLNRYFGLNQPSQILLIGHSHLMLATDKEKLEKGIEMKVSKYCREGVNVSDRFQMISQYLSLPQSNSLQYVFYGVDQFMFTGKGLSKNSHKLFYPFMDNKEMSHYIYQAESPGGYWLHKIIRTTRYSDALINSSIRGWRKDWSNYKSGYLNVDALQSQIKRGEERHIEFEQELVNEFEKTIQMLISRNIRIILVNPPIAAPLNTTEPEQHRKIISYFQKLATSNPSVYYWDYNQDYSNQYRLFFDPIHLNPEGQQAVTKKLISDFKKLQSHL